MKSAACRLALVLLTACSLLACDQDGGPSGPTDTSTDTTAPDVTDETPTPDATPDAEPEVVDDPVPETTETYSVSGTVGRDYATCPPLYGGIGTLCLHMLTDCTDISTEVASATVPSADMSWPTNTIDFTITDVPSGSLQLLAYHDDDESGCNGTLTSGDFYSGDMCVAVTVDGADVTGVNITFNNKSP
ncbi:MAG: hypothetical protein JRG91_06605 [Deltaproteobacteria bacterium]|nr:hypothetical protein [Deltaproteobacteria bacterium]